MAALGFKKKPLARIWVKEGEDGRGKDGRGEDGREGVKMEE